MNGDEIITITIKDSDGNQISTSYSLLQAARYKGGINDYHIAVLDLAFIQLKHQVENHKSSSGSLEIISDAIEYSKNPKCGCHQCNPTAWWMICCDICGNKRCPHATNHNNPCTGSNEPGQPGSIFANVKN